MKRSLCLFLVLILLVAAVPACKAPAAVDARDAFLNLINAGDYGAAYDMLHSSVRYDADRAAKDIAENKPQPANRISKEQFAARYEAIFEELEIAGLSYTSLSSVEGEAICVYDYLLSYDSPLIGGQEMEFRMSVRRENSVWTVEWTPALLFPEMGWGDTVRVGKSAALRGEILADGVVYAQTVNAVSVIAVPDKIEDTAQFARQTAMLLDMSVEAVEKKLKNVYGDFAILKQLYPDELTESLEEQLLLIPGVSIDKSNFGTLRYYPQKNTLAHILGYVGPASPEDLKTLTGSEKGNDVYTADSRVGKSGLESIYENQLRGTDGYYIYISAADGLNKKTLYEKQAENGLDVQLTLDPDLQRRTEVLLQYSLFGEDTAGAVVVLNPRTGAIEAMASYPSFDLNLFARGIPEADWQRLSTQKNAPLFNRLTRGLYPPGSMFKPYTAAVALESGAMTPESTFPMNRETIEEDKWLPSDNGEFGPWGYATITRVHLQHRHSPPLNMHTGMIDSDNIYFAYAALKTGTDAFVSFMENAGYTESIPFDTSVLPAQLKNKKSEWSPMLLAESSYGQGEVLITPLQAACMFSAFANNGSIQTPYVVKGLYRTEGPDYTPVKEHEDSVWKANVVRQDTVNTLTPLLEDVIESGTGNWLHMDDIAGKTGTAEVGNDKTKEINWFAGYRLRTEEDRLVLVMLEVPANSEAFSQTKFDIARELLKREEAREE
ncbi:MAG TPA: penicillin-binding transpeptidase domain-containing protein [Feifaniaceae bacterium]|nr:penicillin-binding transpeptidase domain-containing protein [Feifaniaceae bacterium]